MFIMYDNISAKQNKLWGSIELVPVGFATAVIHYSGSISLT